MPLRLMVAYGLILAMLLAIGGLVAWKLYHSERRTYRRQQQRQARAHDQFGDDPTTPPIL